MVIDKHFADQHLANLVTFKEPNQQNSIVLWAEQKRHQIISLINDSIHVNGKKIFLNAVVADLSLIPEWKEYDMIFPIKELGQVIKINLQNLSLEVGGDITPDASSCVWKMQADSDTKGLFLYMASWRFSIPVEWQKNYPEISYWILAQPMHSI